MEYKDFYEDILDEIINIDPTQSIYGTNSGSPQNIPFTVNGMKYVIEFSSTSNVKNGVVGIFKLKNGPNRPKWEEHNDMKSYIAALDDAEMGDTGGNEDYLKVLSIVINTFIDYMNKTKPEIFIFHARNLKRARLYEKVCKTIESHTGYKMSKRTNPNTNITEFHFTKSSESMNESKKYFKSQFLIESTYDEWMRENVDNNLREIYEHNTK